MVFDFLWRIIRKLPYERPITITYLAALVTTWLAALIVIFVECRPFTKYWQITPDPGQCVQGNAWLITYEIGNLITDLMLLALPFPLLFMARVPWKKRIRLFAVFSLGFFLVATCIIRMTQGLMHDHFQSQRSMWASIEVLIATVVACGPSMYCTLRRGRDRNTITSGSTTLRNTRPTGSPSGSGMGSASALGIFGESKEILGGLPGGSRGGESRIGLTASRNTTPSTTGGSGYYQPRPRPSSAWSATSNERHRKTSIASREISRHSSTSSRHSRPVSRQSSQAGFNLDISTLGGDIPMAGTDIRRHSAVSSVGSHHSDRDLESIGDLIDEKIEGQHQEGEEEEFERFWIIDEERDTGTGDLAEMVVEATWTQFNENDEAAGRSLQDHDPDAGIEIISRYPVPMILEPECEKFRSGDFF
ncbi:hypothetical protein ABW21_db0206700 [Orbilia brochopaga]|nr:hypothetical protein ABW21_db0206700 [Drechslerella brochopaga]